MKNIKYMRLNKNYFTVVAFQAIKEVISVIRATLVVPMLWEAVAVAVTEDTKVGEF